VTTTYNGGEDMSENIGSHGRVTPREAMRKLRANPVYRKKGLYYQRNREAVRYAAKCREAGIAMTVEQARKILDDNS
jgi:hypothetical protein